MTRFFLPLLLHILLSLNPHPTTAAAPPPPPPSSSSSSYLNACEYKHVCTDITEYPYDGIDVSAYPSTIPLQVGRPSFVNQIAFFRNYDAPPFFTNLKLIYRGKSSFSSSSGGMETTQEEDLLSDFGYEDYFDYFSSGVLDSLNMTFELNPDKYEKSQTDGNRDDMTNQRELKFTVLILLLVVEDFEEIGPFVADCAPDVRFLSIVVRERRRRTIIKPNLLEGLENLFAFSLYFETNDGLYTSALNPIPNIFQWMAPAGMKKLTLVSAFSPCGNISSWDLQQFPAIRGLSFTSPLLPGADGSRFIAAHGGEGAMASSAPATVLFVTLAALPFPKGMRVIKTGRGDDDERVGDLFSSSYWDISCSSMSGVTDPKRALFYFPQSRNFSLVRLRLVDVKYPGSSDVMPLLFRKECPIVWDLSSMNSSALEFNLNGFHLDSLAWDYLKELKPLGINISYCVFSGNKSFLSPNLYNRNLERFSYINNNESGILHPDGNDTNYINMNNICKDDGCEKIFLSAESTTASSPTTVAIFEGMNYNVQSSPDIYIRNVGVDDAFWDFISQVKLTKLRQSMGLELELPSFTKENLDSIFLFHFPAPPCVPTHKCSTNLISFNSIKLVATDAQASYSKVKPAIALDHSWMSHFERSFSLENIPVSYIGSQAFGSIGTGGRYRYFEYVSLRDTGVEVLHEGCFSGLLISPVFMSGTLFTNLTKPLIYETQEGCFSNFESVNGSLVEFDIFSLHMSVFSVYYGAIFASGNIGSACLQRLDLSNNFIVNLTMDSMFKYFDFAGERSPGYRSVLNFTRNDISTVWLANDIPPRGEASNRNIEHIYDKGEASFDAFLAAYSTKANILIDISFNNVEHLGRGSIDCLGGLRMLNLSHNQLQQLEGGFIMNRSCIGTGCIVDLSHNLLGDTSASFLSLEDALYVQALEHTDTPIHTLDLSYNNLTRVPRFAAAILPALNNIIGDMSRPNEAIGRPKDIKKYLTLDLSHNRIEEVNSSVCEAMDLSLYDRGMDISVYVDLSFNNISKISADVFDCGPVRVMLNLNNNPHLHTLPEVEQVRHYSLTLLSVSGTAIRSIPLSYGNPFVLYKLRSLNLEWSVPWKCCELWDFVRDFPRGLR
eukprot:Nk52_evm1s1671 gene=Nk52_evmTU1s1671